MRKRVSVAYRAERAARADGLTAGARGA